MRSSSIHRRVETRGRKPMVAYAGVATAPRDILARIDEIDIRFADFIRATELAHTHSGRTLRWYRSVYDAAFRPYLATAASTPHDAFRGHVLDIPAWVAWMRPRVSPITVNNYWRAMRPFINDLARSFAVDSPYRAMRAPTFHAPPPKGKSSADCERILRGARNHPWPTAYQKALAVAVIATMLYAGLRRSEVLDLDYEDVDFEQQTIRVRHGKGRDGGKERYVPIAPELEMILRSYVRERSDGAYSFFVGARGWRLGIAGMTDIVVRVRRTAGVHFSAHTLRHCFVTNLVMNGVPLPVVRDLAGHSDFATTLAYTAVQTPERMAAISSLKFLSA